MHNLFKDVDDDLIRLYNSVVFSHNLLEDAGKEAVEEYLKQFSEQDKLKMFAIYNLIQKKGVPYVKKMIFEDRDFVDYDKVSSGEIEVGSV